MRRLDQLESEYLRTDLPDFDVGDTVEVDVRIREGDKERTQVFSGTVIARDGSGTRETFTVRRIVQGEGVERIFPVCSPAVAGLKVTRKGKVRRAKLYYLRDRVGKATRVRERILEAKAAGPAAAPPAPAAPTEDDGGEEE